MIPWFKEGDILVYVFKSFINSIDINLILNSIKLSKSGVMIVMPMRPNYSIYTGKVLLEKLLPEVRAGINKDFALIRLYEDRRAKTLALPTLSSILTGRTITSYFRSSDSVTGPKQC
jgi:hypothetical protein